MIRCAVLGASFALILLAAPAGCAVAPAAPPAKIVLIWTAPDHAWGTHMYEHDCRLLAACLNESPGVSAIVSPDPDWPRDPAVLEDVRAIVFYSRQAGDIVLGPDRRDEFRRHMQAGVGFVAIHWATKAEDPALLPEYLEVLGGAFHTLPGWGLKTDTLPLVQRRPDHPVCRGWKGYDLRDEFYLGVKFHERAQHVLSVNVDGADQTVAWVFERAGGGRSFGTTLAHFHDNFGIEAFRRAIVNGILWSAGVDVPAGGAPVALGAEHLELGPEPARP